MRPNYIKPIIRKKKIKIAQFMQFDSIYDPLSDLLADCQTCPGTVNVRACGFCGKLCNGASCCPG